MKGEGGIGNKNKSSAARAYSRKSRKAEDSNARGERDKEAITEDLQTCPGCIKCGPPIAVKADEGCDGSGSRPTRSAKLREIWCVACGLHIEVWDGLCGECIDRELDSELDR